MTPCTIVIPTRDRPNLIQQAVDSALSQTVDSAAVLVVDDGSTSAVSLPRHPRLRVVRHLRPRGVSAARNLGLSLATTSLVTFLDDDDLLRPDMIEQSLTALERTDVLAPVAVVSGVAVVDGERITGLRRPPSLRPKGAHYSLEPIEPDRSYLSKQTLVAPRDVLLSIGGFDEGLRSRVVTELFWRLNPVCSIIGIPQVTYELRAHSAPRISTDLRLRRESFGRLERIHRALLAAHPEGYAELLAQHARICRDSGQQVAAAAAALRHARVAPRRTAKAVRRAVSH